jgi:hypothetical protein
MTRILVAFFGAGFYPAGADLKVGATRYQGAAQTRCLGLRLVPVQWRKAADLNNRSALRPIPL